ncbi:hypothetical protein MTO96_043863 [Rhipicephalus appendiculatus]
MAVPVQSLVQYGQQDPFAPSVGGPGTFGTPPYAADPYGQPALLPPPEPAIPPAPTYDPGYANYLYGLAASPRSSRRYIIQSPTGRKGMFSGSSVLTVVIIVGTLFLVFLAMLLIVTVVMPRLSRKHHAGHRRRHQLPHDLDNLADAETPMDAPQMSAGSTNEQAESKLDTTEGTQGPKQGHKDPETTRHVKSRAKG